MGVQSALVRLLMKAVPSTNVMTTNTTTAAVEAAQWLVAARNAAKNPRDAGASLELHHARRRFNVVWPVMVGFLAGTAIGSAAFQMIGFLAPLSAVVVLAGVLVWSTRLRS